MQVTFEALLAKLQFIKGSSGNNRRSFFMAQPIRQKSSQTFHFQLIFYNTPKPYNTTGLKKTINNSSGGNFVFTKG